MLLAWWFDGFGLMFFGSDGFRLMDLQQEFLTDVFLLNSNWLFQTDGILLMVLVWKILIDRLLQIYRSSLVLLAWSFWPDGLMVLDWWFWTDGLGWWFWTDDFWLMVLDWCFFTDGFRLVDYHWWHWTDGFWLMDFHRLFLTDGLELMVFDWWAQTYGMDCQFLTDAFRLKLWCDCVG